MTDPIWPFPGFRWWRFDFHTHTPVSRCTHWSTPGLDLSPRDWLLKYMQAGIDCVAVTDHNSGDWVDGLKAAYATLAQEAAEGRAQAGFRDLTLFPGVEISVSGGFHLLAIFDPSQTTRAITDLLAVVGYRGTHGDSDAVTEKGPAEVVAEVLKAGGIPIPAHADRPEDKGKGLLALKDDGSGASRLDANTISGVLDNESLLAVEWDDMDRDFPECVRQHKQRLARVLGSDCHNFRGTAVPGSRYTWVKMARPTLEGLRLALLDGNGVSIRRSDEGPFDPFRTPEHCITAIEVEGARFMGNGQVERLEFSPYYNALIGGRGTGKSTIVHALRLTLHRDDELARLPDTAEPRTQFDRFRRPVKGREGDGALRDGTRIRVELLRDGIPHRLHWAGAAADPVVEQRGPDGDWVPSASQAINPDRFPVRIFSQGQIAAVAGDGRGALLDVIDAAAGVGDLRRVLDEARRTWLAQRARLREIEQRLAVLPELERKLGDVTAKLDALAKSHQADVLKAHQSAQRQHRELDQTWDQLAAVPGRLNALKDDLLIDDLPEGIFAADGDDAPLQAWRQDANAALAQLRDDLDKARLGFAQRLETLGQDERLTAWWGRFHATQQAYADLQAMLAAQGVADPQAFGRLVQESQTLDGQRKSLIQLQTDRGQLQQDHEAQWTRLLAARQAVSERRKAFVADALHGNDFVHIQVEPFGFDPRAIRRSIRDLVDVLDDRFVDDILRFDDRRDPVGGLAYDLAKTPDKNQALNALKGRLTTPDPNLGGHFRNFLQRKLGQPEFADRIWSWFPEDDLCITYSQRGDGSHWTPLDQGSPGQKAAALLAFLLAFGDEPLILDQPEDDLDNHLIYDLIVKQIRANKLRRQLIIVTHNPNLVVNGDAEMVHAFDFRGGQCRVVRRGALQERELREEVCRVMEGGHDAFARRWARLGREV